MKSLEERLSKHTVEIDSGCIEWTGCKNDRGYGTMTINGHTVRVHRIAWTIRFGSIPLGLCVLHRCDNPACVNPYHLFLGTQLDNITDMVSKGRASNQNKNKTHCKNGHPFSSSNTRTRQNGYRDCKQCDAHYHKLRYNAL